MAVKPSNLGNIKIEDYSYDLPASRIAQEPLAKRDDSKLLVYGGLASGVISDSRFSNLSDFIPSNSFMIVNNSRVIHARLLFLSSTGAHIEILFLEPISNPSIELAMSAKSGADGCVWSAYVGNARRWRDEELSSVVNGVKIVVSKLGTPGETHQIKIRWSNVDSGLAEFTFGELLERVGHVPLPPYMKRDDVVSDKERYQTVYAKPQGSVAAPTAGLHFTPQVMAKLISKGVSAESVTLHVGAGTFKPVTSDTIENHTMHSEQIVVSKSFIEELKLAVETQRNIVSVGTTSVRTIESLYWIGVKILGGNKNINLKQWDAYELPQDISVGVSLSALISYLNSEKMNDLRVATQLLIAPGYKFRFVNMLITNFHVPKSTLLLLVAAFIGDDWKKVYSHALANDYRFLSYGDSSLLVSYR